MSLLDAARARQPSPHDCWVRRLPDDLREELRAVEEAIAAGEPINQSAVGRELKARGIDVGQSTVDRHFRGDCRCG